MTILRICTATVRQRVLGTGSRQSVLRERERGERKGERQERREEKRSERETWKEREKREE